MAVQRTMRAAVVEGFGQPLSMRAIEVPRPKRGELLVRLQTCGVCHSDVHIWRGDFAAAHPQMPFVLGHEGIGEVVELGDGVTAWTCGDIVGVPWLHSTCGECIACSSGQESFCSNQKAHGLDVPGAFAEYVVVRAEFAVAIPAGLDSLELAPIMCAGVTAYGALQRSKVQAGQTVAIFGCGGLGLYAVQLAKRLGLHVIAIDTDERKLAHASQLGAERTHDGSLPLPSHLRACGHACINFAPTAATWGAMVSMIRPLGTIVAAAMVPETVPLNQEWLTGSGVTIAGTSVGTREQMAAIVAMHAKSPFTGNVFPISLNEAGNALDALYLGKAFGRYVIDYRLDKKS